MKQQLQVIQHWDKGLSHPKLVLSSDITRCQRREYFEFYPVAVARVLSWTCVGMFIIRCESQLRDFSIGVLSLQEYSFDHNLADCLGKIPESWALVQTCAAQGAQVWSCGQSLASYPALRSGDCIGIYLDQNDDDDDDKVERGCGCMHIVLNKVPVFTLRGLRRGVYGMASTMAPSSELSILSDKPVAEALMCSTQQVRLEAEAEARGGDSRHGDSKHEAQDDRDEIPGSILTQHNLTVPTSTTTSTLQDCTPLPLSPRARPSAPTDPATVRAGPPPVPAYFPSLPLLSPAPRVKPPTATATTAMAVGGMECCVCMSAAKTVVFMPCKHLCTCESCSQLEHCPMCRLRVKSRIRVFI